MKIWDRHAATDWEGYYPLGSGRLGAMISGDARQNTIILNDDRLYSASHPNRVNPAAKDHWRTVQQDLVTGQVSAAETLAQATMFAIPEKQANYEVLATLKLTMNGLAATDQPQNYQRSLDLTTALYHEQATFQNFAYQAEHFTDFEHHQLVGHYQATKGRLNLTIALNRSEGRYNQVRAQGDYCQLVGQASGQCGDFFSATVQVRIGTGQIHFYRNHIVLTNVDWFTLKVSSMVAAALDEVLVAPVSWQNLDAQRDQHGQTYQYYFQRTHFDLQVPKTDHLDTRERLRQAKQSSKTDPILIQTLFDYGKYLLISASQPGTEPTNLQGIWCQDLLPLWGSKYTININTEMNYWLTGPLQLSELMTPLRQLFLKTIANGKIVARTMYGLPGSVVHHNTDKYGDAAPQSTTLNGTLWPLGGIWLANEFFRAAQYTDQSIDATLTAAMCQLAEFFVHYLVPDGAGRLVAAPSVSPENSYYLGDYVASLSAGTTLDNSLLREFFGHMVQLADQQSVSAANVKTWQHVLDRLPLTPIRADGRIQEYAEDYPEYDLGHRHFSPLYGLFPGDEFQQSLQLLKASRQFLAYRLSHGGAGTGWSLAWLINLWARLKAGDAAGDAVNRMFSQSTQVNLLNSHPPFQIDGNFGFTNGICEMLVQSTPTTLTLLPALPTDWPAGELTGIQTRCGLVVSIRWANGQLTEFSYTGQPKQIIKLSCCHVAQSIQFETTIFKYSDTEGD